jgi:hypothetical protein
MENNFEFRCGGKRIAVSFHNETITGYVPRKYVPGTKPRTTKRNIILCLVRLAWTGKPHSGVAVLSPNEELGTMDETMARTLAMRRAFRAYESENKLDKGILWSQYRLWRMSQLDPEKFAAIVERKREEKERRNKKAGKKKARNVVIENVVNNLYVEESQDSAPSNGVSHDTVESTEQIVAPKKRGRPRKVVSPPEQPTCLEAVDSLDS